MVLTLSRLLLAAALVYAVGGSGARWGVAAEQLSDRPATGGVTLVASPIAADLVAGRTTGTASPLGSSGGLTVPAVPVLAGVAVALALALHVDLTPTGRLGLAHRRGPPLLLAARV